MIDVTAAIITQEQHVLLARRKPGKHLEGYWELPGGKIEPGETPEQCLQREIMEEFGADISVLRYFCDSVHSYDKNIIKLLGYLCTLNGPILFTNDHDDWKYVSYPVVFDYKIAPADIPILEQLVSTTH